MQSAVKLCIAEDTKSLCGLKWRMDKFMEDKSFII